MCQQTTVSVSQAECLCFTTSASRERGEKANGIPWVWLSNSYSEYLKPHLLVDFLRNIYKKTNVPTVEKRRQHPVPTAVFTITREKDGTMRVKWLPHATSRANKPLAPWANEIRADRHDVRTGRAQLRKHRRKNTRNKYGQAKLSSTLQSKAPNHDGKPVTKQCFRILTLSKASSKVSIISKLQ